MILSMMKDYMLLERFLIETRWGEKIFAVEVSADGIYWSGHIEQYIDDVWEGRRRNTRTDIRILCC